MDKNIAALLREDTRTVQVTFPVTAYEAARAGTNGNPSVPHSAGKLYTYVTHLDLQVGDAAIVRTSGKLNIVLVAAVDGGTNIAPNSEIEYKWILAKVDLSEAEENEAKNDLITATVAEAYKLNLRRSFSQQILEGLSDTGAKETLLKLLSK